jgi:hypothetical protein
MAFLASDALNGRGSGTRDEWIAASYIASHFQRWGLAPLGSRGFVHEIRVERSELAAPPVLTFAGRRAIHGKDILVTAFAAARMAGPLQKYQRGTPVRPGVALLVPPADSPGADETAGAAIVLALESEPLQKRRLAGPTASGPQLRMQWIVDTPRRAAVALDETTYEVVAALADGSDIALDAEVKPVQVVSTWNAVGRLEGRHPARKQDVLVLSAHLDHVGHRPSSTAVAGADTIYNGADDDASGTIAIMELAQALSREALERTIIFALFGSEEVGGLGSAHFIDGSGVALDTIVANLQFEMIGRPDPKVPPHTLWLTGHDRSDLGEQLARRGARLVADPHPEQSFFTRSDNIRFARRGIVAHTVSSYGLHKEYHQPSDEIGTIDFAHMTRAIQSMIQPIRWLATSEYRPSWKQGMRP